MSKLITITETHQMSGEYSFEDYMSAQENTLILPVGTGLPAITSTNGQIIFIYTSGILAVTDGGVWVTASGV